MSRGGRKGDEGGVSFFAFQDIITSVIGILVLITLILALDLREKPPEEGKEKIAPAEEEIIEDEEDNGTDYENLVAEQKTTNEIPLDKLQTLEEELEKVKEKSELEILLLQKRINEIAQAVDAPISDEQKKEIETLEKEMTFAKNNISELEKEINGLRDQLDSNPMAFMEEDEEKDAYVTRLMDEIPQLEEQIQNDVRVIPEKSDTRLKPVLVSISATPPQISMGEFNEKTASTPFNRSTFIRELARGFSQYDPATHYFVFFFKPSACNAIVDVKVGGQQKAMPIFDVAVQYAHNREFKFGYEPIHEEAVLIFSNQKEESSPEEE